MGDNMDGDVVPEPGAAAPAAAAARPERGLDAGLAKAAPDPTNLTAHEYRTFRRRLQLFARMCYKRGQQTASEGAFLIVQQLTGEAWAASETIDLDVLDTGDRPFDEIFTCLDRLYQYEPEVEMPLRCEEFFSSFQRNTDETLNAYVARHGGPPCMAQARPPGTTAHPELARCRPC